MHNLANSFPEMGQGLFAVVVLGAALLLALAALVMVYSALQLVRARFVKPPRSRLGSASAGAPAKVRVPAR
jgi:hypothetical protein